VNEVRLEQPKNIPSPLLREFKSVLKLVTPLVINIICPLVRELNSPSNDVREQPPNINAPFSKDGRSVANETSVLFDRNNESEEESVVSKPPTSKSSNL
jgi:hypothetical protein